MRKLVIIIAIITSIFFAKSDIFAANCNASFTYTIVQEISPFTVSFSDESSTANYIVSWEWNFGDGQHSRNSNPTHQYLSAGDYVVGYTITDNVGNVSSFVDTLNLVDVVNVQSTTNFNYTMLSGTQLYTYNFIDHSLAINDSIISWHWDFGDASASVNTKNTTHTFLDTGIYTVILTTTTATGVSSSQTQQLIVSIVVDQCSANFSYTNGNTNEIYFTDLSISDSTIIQWHWEFGDGSYTNTQNPVHQYAYAGVYYVELTMYSAGCSDVVVIPIMVGVPQSYSLWGRVYVGNLTTDQCVAYLYRQCNNGCIYMLDTINLTSINDSLGIYYFYQIPEGNYFVNIDIPTTSDFYGDYAPTYYGDSPFWSQSQIIPLYSDMGNMHINMTPIVHQYGTNVIQGQVFSEDSIAESDVLVLLYNSNGDLLEYTYSNYNGAYMFDEVPSGEYSVYGEYIGYISNPAITPNLGSNDTVSNADFIISNGISAGFIKSDINKPNIDCKIFPNPATNGKIYIHFDNANRSNYYYKIFNILGEEVMSDKICLVNNEVEITTSNLSGVYLIAIYDAKGVMLSTKKIIIE